MIDLFNMRDYWPNPSYGTEIVNTFDNDIVQTYRSAFPNDKGVELYEVIKGNWNDSWFYIIDPSRGVLEYSDWYPPTKWYNFRLFGPVVKQPCVPGKEIIWGGNQRVGDTIQAQCQTSGILGQFGWQRVKFDALLPTYTTPAGTFGNVLVLEYWQSWGNGGDVKGAQMWFAPGLGQIKANWTLNGKPTGFGMTLQRTLKWVPVA